MDNKQSTLLQSYLPSPLALRLISKVHTLLYRLSFGHLGHRLDGLNILLLTTTGRKSGRYYQTPMPYFHHPKGYLLIASNAGANANPGWYFNLQQQPNATIQIQSQRHRVIARSLENHDRDSWWQELVMLQPRFKTYQETTHRRIPIVLLAPVTT